MWRSRSELPTTLADDSDTAPAAMTGAGYSAPPL
jgi:hypothetical protein